MAGNHGAPPPAPGPGVGVGKGHEPARPTSLAEAEAEHARLVRKCEELTVTAARRECIRQAQRNLQLDRERLQKANPAAGADAASAPRR
jgi:hypothetical protein